MKWVFWTSAGLIAYTYAGYLGWLSLLARLHPWPVGRGPYEPFVSIVMVVRNEEQILEDKLRNLLELDYPAERRHIIVVSDGSTDRTEAILRKHASEPGLHAVMNQPSHGKAFSLNRGMELAQGEIVVFADARQIIESGAIGRLIENFADPEVGCASGELMLGNFATGEADQGMGLYWRIEKQVRELESASGSVVGATGALYAVRRELLTVLPVVTILDDVFLPMQVLRQGKRVIFDSRARAWDSADLGANREFSRKVRTLSGNYQLMQLAPWLLSSENPILFRFVSHKLLRLVMPFALAAMLAASLWLRGSVYRVALGLQLGLYGLSVLSSAGLLKRGPLARLADVARTFVLLNTAAVVAFANFVTRRRAAWTR